MTDSVVSNGPSRPVTKWVPHSMRSESRWTTRSPEVTNWAFHNASPLPLRVPRSGRISRARWTVAPAASATAYVSSTESESMTTTSSMRGTADTRSRRNAWTIPPTVAASSRAGMTTETRRPRLSGTRADALHRPDWGYPPRAGGCCATAPPVTASTLDGGSERRLAAKAPVGVEHRVVEDGSPAALGGRERGPGQSTQLAGRTLTAPVVVEPGIEGGSAGDHRLEDGRPVGRHLVRRHPEVFGHQLPAQGDRERVLVHRPVVDHRAGDLRVARPGSPVEVVRPHRGPPVVDDAHLGVDVDRPAGAVGQAEHRDPVTAGGQDEVEGQGPAVQLDHLGHALLVRHHRQDDREPQVRRGPQRPGEVPAHLLRPQVLVLDVDELLGPGDRFGIAERDAALALHGEVEADRPDPRVGPQHLDRARPGGRWRRRLFAQRVRPLVLALQQAGQPAGRVRGERRAVLPPLPERGLDIVDSRSPDRQVDVVPGRSRPVCRGDRQHLWVTLVGQVVTPAVAQVDPADVGDIAAGVRGIPDDDELLVVRAEGPDPHVPQALPAGLLQVLAQVAGLLGVVAEVPPVRAPQQPADVGAPLGSRHEGRRHRARRVVGQLFVRVATPVREVQPVAGPQRADPLVQLGEVRPTVDDRAHRAPRAPRLLTRVPVVDPGVRVVPLGRGEEPVGEGHQCMVSPRLLFRSCSEDAGTICECRSGWRWRRSSVSSPACSSPSRPARPRPPTCSWASWLWAWPSACRSSGWSCGSTPGPPTPSSTAWTPRARPSTPPSSSPRSPAWPGSATC